METGSMFAKQSQQTEPTTVEEVLNSSEKDHWNQAMEKDMKSLKDNDVWKLVETPKGHKAVKTQKQVGLQGHNIC